MTDRKLALLLFVLLVIGFLIGIVVEAWYITDYVNRCR